MCSKQYYDLGRTELECPECGKEIEVTTMSRPRRGRKPGTTNAAPLTNPIPPKPKEKVVNENGNGVIHKGISTRQFERSFTISEDIKVKDAELQNGLLTIDLERIIPEEKKARLISIK